VTMPVEFGARQVLPLVLGFMEAHPDVTVKLVTADRMVNLVEEQVDVAVRLGHLADSGLFAVKVGAYRMLTCAAPRYLERRGAPAHPRELPDHDGVLFGNPAAFWSYRIDGEDVVCAPRTRLAVSTVASNHAAALGGVGIARLFDYQLADEFASGALVRVLADHDGEPRPIHLVYPRQGLLPLKVRAFIDWTAPRLRAACERFAA
jgi:DNA-binding transcriptional LysR family regulator